MIWLGEKRGELSDWVTQKWVCTTGRAVSLREYPWLEGPTGPTRGIGREFFREYAQTRELELVEDGVRGLIPSFAILRNPDLFSLSAEVRDFYEQTSEFDLDSWSEWHGMFRPFGHALSLLFSLRLQQLNLPLSPLDSARGMTSEVQQMRERSDGRIVETAWVRELRATGNVLYAGSYSVCDVPGCSTPCVKVVFPLPNGRAIVLMRSEGLADGSLSVRSVGNRFGDPGFYFVVEHEGGRAWARYVASLKEEIRVYAAEPGSVRADHRFWFWGVEFFRIHYRMCRKNRRSDASGLAIEGEPQI